jgi:hypothetical protein
MQEMIAFFLGMLETATALIQLPNLNSFSIPKPEIVKMSGTLAVIAITTISLIN